MLFFVGDSSFPCCQHVVERVTTDACSDGFHPLLLLLGAGRRDAVNHVVPLHHAPVCLCLTGLDHLPFVARVVKLEAVRLSGVFHLPDAEVLQRDDPPGLLVLNRKVASVPGTASLQACY